MNENNIYIGNRYVPIVVGEWDKNRSYESLSIVTYAGTSYTSTKNVPAGTEISNTDFWVVTGNYNAQVEQYRKETEALAKKVENITNRNIIVIGDSYGKGWDQAGNQYTPYTTYATRYTGVPITNVSESGAGFANEGDSGNTFVNLIANLASTMTKTDRDKVTDIIVIGGYNDRVHSNSEINTGISSFSTIVKNSFVNAKMAVGAVGWSTYSQDYPMLAQMVWCYKTFGTRNKMAYITDVEKVMHVYDLFSSDGIHPNENGQSYIGTALASWILGSRTMPIMKRRFKCNLVANGTIVTTNNIFMSFDNNVCTISWDSNFNVTKMQMFGKHSLNGSEQFKVGTLNVQNETVRGLYGAMFSTPCTFHFSDNTYIIGFATFKLINTEIFLELVAIENNAFVEKTIDFVTLPPTSYTVSNMEN
jgi:hypothetical protein